MDQQPQVTESLSLAHSKVPVALTSFLSNPNFSLGLWTLRFKQALAPELQEGFHLCWERVCHPTGNSLATAGLRQQTPEMAR